MNRSIKHISIPQPCTQNWGDMDVAAQGRFCQSCQKMVTDFTGLTNNEIIKVLSSSGNTCGRLNEGQLQSLNTLIAVQQASYFSWKKLSLAAVFIGFVPFVKAKAQTVSPQVEQGPRLFNNSPDLIDTTIRYRTFSGKVLSTSDQLPIPGVTIKLKGTSNTVVTDVNGVFQFYMLAPGQQKFTASFIGFLTQDFTISSSKEPLTVLLKESPNNLTGELVIVKRPPWWKRPYYSARRFFHKIFS